uniref:FBD domain-containing protein n=1 Tax=Brassica campestris TaxID=3711 RepID=A0A3P5ZML4_BRACM|nr:unnamed protein product [Brassica rapa]
MDMISTLSDDLLLKILSSLPTKAIVSTMLLSKRWKFIWTMVPTLDFQNDFESSKDDYARFRQHVYLFMVLHKSPLLETLKLRLGWHSTNDDITTWIKIAVARRVRKLKIHCYSDDDDIFLPSCLYTYNNLEVLKLGNSIVLDVPEDVRLPSLKTLHLLCVEFRNEESARRLLSGCPLLEEFVLDKSENVSPPCFYLEVPSLQRLSILDTYREGNDSDVKVVIKTPSLRYLNVVDKCDSGLLFLSENMPDMVVANVSVVYKNPEMLMRSFTSVKRLSLCLTTSVIQHRVEFNLLVHLELCSSVEKWCELLNWMLESSPKLKVLKLNKCKPHRFVYAKHIEYPWGKPSSVPECLLFHLNTFEWNFYNGCREEKKMVAYILRHAKRLKSAKISLWDLDCEDEPHIFTEWRSFHRASKLCQLLSEREPRSNWYES